MDKLLKEILKKVTPTEEEHEREKKLVSMLEEKLGKKGVKPLLVGSLAKGTDLHADKDVDLFILFPSDVKREELEERGLSIGKGLFDELSAEYEIDYAEHPYVKGSYEGYTIEIVPCYETKKPQSAVDRTPHHTKYVKRKIRENPHLAGDIRLMKQFMKAANVYGAEAKVQGFSGYLTELLVADFGSFVGTLEAVSRWKLNEVIDPEGLWEDREALKLFFPEACLIVVDPTDENRNAAAAVSRQKLAEFIVAVSEFLKEPSERFFFAEPPRVPGKDEILDRMEARGTKIFAVVFRHKKINPNTLYSQLRKTEAAAKKSIEGFDFRVLKSGFWTDELYLSMIFFEFEVWVLPRIRHHVGPSVESDPRDQEKFAEKYRDLRPYIKEGRWAVDVEREFKEAKDLLPKLVSERRGFGKDLRVLDDVKVFKASEVVGLGGDGLLVFLDRFLSLK